MARTAQAENDAPQLILWTGPKHSGKTTSLRHLVATLQAGKFSVTGFVAPSLYENDELVGFDVVELDTNRRTPLARRREGCSEGERFAFCPEGLKAGIDCLSRASAGQSDIVVVDEYGPLELAHQGWRGAVDHLLSSSDAKVLLVVREQLADQVARTYGQAPSRKLPAHEPDSASWVAVLLRKKAETLSPQTT